MNVERLRFFTVSKQLRVAITGNSGDLQLRLGLGLGMIVNALLVLFYTCAELLNTLQNGLYFNLTCTLNLYNMACKFDLNILYFNLIYNVMYP
jgi:hypothetical protein